MVRLSESDLRFLVETVATRRKDYENILRLVRDKEDIVEQMLEDSNLFERVLASEEGMVRISPAMLFSILLRRVRRELAVESYVYEIGARGERIPVFEAAKVVELLSTGVVLDYLVEMLCSFVRTQSGTIYWRERGRWHKRAFSDLDLDDLAALCRLCPESQRPAIYKRMADLALFLSGIYPEHASLFVARPRRAFASQRTVGDYEETGRRFYRLTAREAGEFDLRTACEKLAEEFTLARRALNTLSDRFLKSLQTRLPLYPNN